ncbi:Quaternary ammonium compound-resistance protein SugE [Maioricimonas rarisocia]|uniref:Guanidinium exporter n=1 Tax=Maioricimonas rarisocia TaxID=2528026 RepID=A0A517Z0Z3_9PLAN|nr:multidrug efflux SMR transporter [Maioricimonas rarisocia]QDU36148.1 Quaternary ammonium compound-resistance protein SugE [Maioricimonas rarisocia]
MSPWILLLLAGLLETGWAVGLKYTDGFTRLWPSLLTIAAIAASMLLLSLAARQLPIGTAYAIWVGIGALGTVLLGSILFGEPLTPARLLFVLLLIVALAGLKLTGSRT